MRLSDLCLMALLAVPASAHAQSQDQSQGQPPTPTDPAPDEPAVVVVKGKKSDVVRKIDSTVYSVGDSPAAQSGTAADVLNTVPSVTVTPNGDVSLRGNSNVQVYVNGRPSAMMKGDSRAATLQSMPGSDIASVEVITNPSAKYDANGGSIINIVLKADRKPGANATLIANTGDNGRGNVSLSGNVNTGRLNFSGRIALRDDMRLTLRREDRVWRNLTSGETGRTLATSDYLAGRKSGTARMALEYTLNDTDTVTIEASGGHRFAANRTQEFRRNFDAGGELVRDFVRSKRGPNWGTNFQITAAFTRRSEDGSQVHLNASCSAATGVIDRTHRDVFTLPVHADMIDHYLGRTVTQLDQISGDYNLPFGETQEIAAGFDGRVDTSRYSNYRSDVDPLSGAETVDTRLTNRFVVTQHIFAAYLTWQGRLGKWQFQPGARLEGVVTRGQQLTSAMQTRSHFTHLAPTLHLAYIINGEDRWKLSYSRSLQRPDATDLNPFLNYSDPQNLLSGNPDLKPQTVSVWEGGFEHSHDDTSWSANAYYRNSRRTITDYSYFVSDDVMLTTKRNAGRGRSFGVAGETSGKWGEPWKYSFSGNIYHAELEAQDISGMLHQSMVSGEAKMSLDYQPGKADSLHLDTRVSGASLTATGQRSGSSELNLSWRRTITPRLSLTVSANNIWNGGRVRTITRTESVNSVSDAVNGGRVFFVGINYRMGGG